MGGLSPSYDEKPEPYTQRFCFCYNICLLPAPPEVFPFFKIVNTTVDLNAAVSETHFAQSRLGRGLPPAKRRPSFPLFFLSSKERVT